ncbi:GLPGLI family protein [Chitinophaga vietnamensis]|uniref:GLPGLI family protein n=1 Tax=Chitinophaga vietnamensis TaxID=2593957 RepID=UPI001178668D|nr:GLPGLI family protein [Chitinophaga vietnamensis]
MIKHCFLTICFAVTGLTGMPFIYGQQAPAIREGKILYERRVNGYNLMEAMTKAGGLTQAKLDAYKHDNPAFNTSRFVLQFKGGQMVYQPDVKGISAPASIDEWFSMVAYDNVVCSDLDLRQTVVQKHVFGELFTVADSARQIKWKITSETRKIAGFQCRRANAVMMDSVYVVAFYTNEIVPRGGPESFGGLPGMILGIALPHEHITWFAQEVYTTPIAGQLKCVIPENKNRIDNKKFAERLSGITQGWGKMASMVITKAGL